MASIFYAEYIEDGTSCYTILTPRSILLVEFGRGGAGIIKEERHFICH